MFPNKPFEIPSDLSKPLTIEQIRRKYRVGERVARDIRKIIVRLCDGYAETIASDVC